MKISIKSQNHKRYEVKFTLIYFGLFLLETSILFGNSSRHPEVAFSTWIAMTAAHLGGVLVAINGIKIFTKLRRRADYSFRQLIAIGLVISGAASLSYNLLGKAINAPLAHPGSVLLTVIIFGVFWFPQAIVLENLKNTIFQSMETYEIRLIIQSRRNIRESSNFKEIEKHIVDSIIVELRAKCANLIAKIRAITTTDENLDAKSSQLTRLLAGTELREYSIQLEQRGNLIDHKSYVNRAIGSIQLFARQYRLLYWQAAVYNQLSKKIYTIILLLIVAPSMLHYLTILQIIFTTATLTAGSLAIAKVIELVIKANGKRALLISSLLVYLIGSLPGLLQPLEGRLFPKDKVEYPLFILGFMVPAGYYVLIKTLQLIQPSTQKLIEADKLVVSTGVKQAVKEVIEYEFAQTLSHSWAIFVHGKILTRLAATSLRLEQARAKQDESAFEQALDSLMEVLNNPELSYSHEVRTLDEELNVRLTPWDGLVQFEVQIGDGVKAFTGSRILDLGEVLEEAISNSVRHGSSNLISVDLQKTAAEEVKVTVSDNSSISVMQENIKYGLGTKLFNLVSDGRWTLNHNSSGTTFVATINMKEPLA